MTVKHIRCSTCGAFLGKASLDVTEQNHVCPDCKLRFEEKLPRKNTSFTCPRCLTTTRNPHDVEQSYCPQCKVFYKANLIGVRKVLADMNTFRRTLLEHADGLLAASEFNTLIGAMHDMQVLLEGVVKHETESRK